LKEHNKYDIKRIECSRCVFTNKHDPSLVLNSEGICNHCIEYDRKKQFISDHKLDSIKIQKLLSTIKKSSKNSKYDCIIGVSGGIDSTYVALKVKELGLNPLAVHFDNGWNSELAIINIENIVKKLKIDLYTYVVDWDEFKDLQLAYLKASVVDVEAITDQAITAVMFKVARKFGIKYIISGENYRTEGTMPKSWVYIKSDERNIKDIHKKFGTMNLKTYPILGYFELILWQKLFGFRYWRILDDIEYNKETAKKEIIEKLNWRDYGGKHHESIFTKFYQSFFLTKKFNIDKRVSHFSTMICANQLTKSEALEMLKKNVYSEKETKEDINYVCKKFKISILEFDNILNSTPKYHSDYKNIYQILDKIRFLVKISNLLKWR